MAVSILIATGEVITAIKLAFEFDRLGFRDWSDHLNAWYFFFWFFTVAGVVMAVVWLVDWMNRRFKLIHERLNTMAITLETNRPLLDAMMNEVPKINAERYREFSRFRDEVIQFMNEKKNR